MADLHKFTTKEVLNKVLLDSSGNSVAALSHTTQEALNAVLDSANSRLNVSLVGGTISGDITITGDLTVNSGTSTLVFDESVVGDMSIKGADGGTLFLQTSDTAITDNDVLGRINFQAPLEGSGADSILVSASIHAEATGTFTDTVNTTDLVFSTGASEVATERMRFTSSGILQISQDSDKTENLLLYSRNTAKFSGTSNIAVIETFGCNALEIGNASNHPIHFATNNAVRMTIDGSGNIEASADSDTENKIGKVVLYSSTSDHASFSHHDQIHSTAYAIKQESNGKTTINSPTAQSINFTSGNVTTLMKLDANSRISLSNNDGGTGNNTIFGKGTGLDLASGASFNTFFGEDSGANITTSNENTAIGYRALFNNVTGANNTAIGNVSMRGASGQSASNNTAVGHASLLNVTTGSNNTAVGTLLNKAL